MSESTTTVAVPLSKGKRTVFIYATMVMLAGFMAGGYGGGVALPRMLALFDSMNYYSLASALSTLGMMLALPLVGKLGDTFGLKAVVVFGVILQIAGRFAMIYIPNVFGFMILYMVAQFGAGLYTSAPYALIADVVEGHERPRYYGILATFGALGSLIGPVITGVVLDKGYTGFAFVVYVPIMVLSVPFICAFYPNKKTARTSGKFDFAGIFLLVIAVCCIVLWLTLVGSSFAWLSPTSFAMLGGGILSTILLIRIESRHENPSVAIHMLKKPRFRYAFLVQLLLAAFSVIMSGYIIVFAQQMMKVSSTISGTITMPMTIARAVFGVIFGAFLGKNFAKRFRPLTLISLLLVVLGILIVCTLRGDSSMILIYIASVFGGIGSVIPQTAFAPFFQTELQPKEFGAAQGMYTFGSTGGACIFAAVAGAMLNTGVSFISVFILAAVFCILALIFALIGLRVE
jgi:MFS family permease